MVQFYFICYGQVFFGVVNYDKFFQLGYQQVCWFGEYYCVCGEIFDVLVIGDLVCYVEIGEGIQEGFGSSLVVDLQFGFNEFDFYFIVDVYLSVYFEEVLLEGVFMVVFYWVLKKVMQCWQVGCLEGNLLESWQGFCDWVVGVMVYIQEQYVDCDWVLVVSFGGVIVMWMWYMFNIVDDVVVEFNLQICNIGVIQGFFNKNVYCFFIFNQVLYLDWEDCGDVIIYSQNGLKRLGYNGCFI